MGGGLADGFTIEYVELPDRNRPARRFIDSLDDDAAAKVDVLIERLRALWLKYRNGYPASDSAREKIQREAGL
jgi:hypothetical protein